MTAPRPRRWSRTDLAIAACATAAVLSLIIGVLTHG
jgi:hypothetical protein